MLSRVCESCVTLCDQVSSPRLSLPVLQVSKGSSGLIFECESNGEYVTIQDLSFQERREADGVWQALC